jgi:OOP family OmpA-OmpF porin
VVRDGLTINSDFYICHFITERNTSMFEKSSGRKILMGLVTGTLLSAAVASVLAEEGKQSFYVTESEDKPVLLEDGHDKKCLRTEISPNDPTKKFVECGDVEAPKPVVAKEDPCAKDSDNDGVNDCRDKCANTPAGAKVDVNGCTLIGNTHNVVLAGDVTFKFNKADLSPQGKAQLDKVASEILGLKDRLKHVVIVGYTDSVGSDKYNLDLSDKRSKAAAKYLVSKGVPKDKLFAKGQGKAKPVADNKTKEGRAKNRRVEIAITSANAK